jgi:hypothetical protein
MEIRQCPDYSMFESAIQNKPVLREQNAAPKIISTSKEHTNRQISLWSQNSDLVVGLKFVATMQLRTPLRVLLRHGEVHSDRNRSPAKIANEPWEGIWLIKTKTWKELGGADIPNFEGSTIASDIGQIPNDCEYLEFLIVVRTAVEAPTSIDSRIEKLEQIATENKWQAFVGRHGGLSSLIGKFLRRKRRLTGVTFCHAVSHCRIARR